MGLDVLIDKKCKPWIMEINSNPSLNIFLERPIPGSVDGQNEKILQELDKHVKTRVVGEAIRLVTDEGNGEFEGAFDQILPESPAMDEYYLWNKAQYLFDLMLQTSTSKKDPELHARITQFQFLRITKVPEFAKEGSYFKADLEILYKAMLKKYDTTAIDIYAFFEAMEKICVKLYKDTGEGEMTHAEKIKAFLDSSIPFFEEFVQQQAEERENAPVQMLAQRPPRPARK